MEIQSVERGHHVYKCVWTPVNGEELCVVPEDNTERSQPSVNYKFQLKRCIERSFLSYSTVTTSIDLPSFSQLAL